LLIPLITFSLASRAVGLSPDAEGSGLHYHFMSRRSNNLEISPGSQRYSAQIVVVFIDRDAGELIPREDGLFDSLKSMQDG